MENYFLNRKDRFIISAIEIISEIGIQGLSTREIAKRQGVSEATLFRHFKNKNDLLLSVLDYFTQYDKDLFQSTRIKNLKPTEAIIYLISALAGYYESYPEIIALMQTFNVLSFEAELTDRVKNIMSSRSQFIKQLIEDAQKTDEIRPDIDSDHLLSIIFGFFHEICSKWRLENRSFSLKDRTLLILNDIFNAFKSK